MNRTLTALAALSAMMAPPVASPPPARATPPLVGSGGLCANAQNLASYIQATYPGVLSIGGTRQDRLPDHPSGHALDVMVGSDTALGDIIANDIRSQSERFGLRYSLWRVPQHFDHIHFTVY